MKMFPFQILFNSDTEEGTKGALIACKEVLYLTICGEKFTFTREKMGEFSHTSAP